MNTTSLFVRGAVASAATVLLIALTGCSSPQPRTYRVTVRNNTDTPLTIGFTKDGPPLELRWASPEELTDIPPSRRPDHWGQVIDPHTKASTKVEGTFDARTNAYLRIYLGAPPLPDLLAMSRGNGYRSELSLQPTVINDYTVETTNGRLNPHQTPRSPNAP